MEKESEDPFRSWNEMQQKLKSELKKQELKMNDLMDTSNSMNPTSKTNKSGKSKPSSFSSQKSSNGTKASKEKKGTKGTKNSNSDSKNSNPKLKLDPTSSMAPFQKAVQNLKLKSKAGFSLSDVALNSNSDATMHNSSQAPKQHPAFQMMEDLKQQAVEPM